MRVSLAFILMRWLLDISYPLGFLLSQAQALVFLFTYYFVARLIDVDDAASIGGDYFTFVVIGILTVRMMGVGLSDLGRQVDDAIQQGRFEMLLMEPIRWRVLPIALVQWDFVQRAVLIALMVLLSVPMGATYDWSSLPQVVAVTALGITATLGIGIVAMSVKVLARRSDPVLAIYTLAAQVLSGQFFPVDELPTVLRWVSYGLPQTHVISANRQLLMPAGDGITGLSPGASALLLAVLSVIVVGGGLWVLGRSLELGRRLGVLGGY